MANIIYGGFSAEIKADSKRQELTEKCKDRITQHFNQQDPGEMTAISFRQQLVNGENFVIKVRTENLGYLLIWVYQPIGKDAAFYGLQESMPIDTNWLFNRPQQ